MHLVDFQVQQLRNLKMQSLTFSSLVNLFFGDNGSGKTSLLEAVYILGMGRSFRSRQSQHLIQKNTDFLSVNGQLLDEEGRSISCQVTKNQQGATRIKINQQNVLAVSKLAQMIPLICINHQTFELLEGLPVARRNYMDWGVFHMEPNYANCYKQYRRCLSQRNSLLREAITHRDSIKQLEFWNAQMAEAGEQIHQFRQSLLDELMVEINACANRLFIFTQADAVKIQYNKGWPKGKTLLQSLQDNLESDIRGKRSHFGPHRADLKMTLDDGSSIASYLSRGQKKLFIFALKIALGKLLQNKKGKRCIYLIDDLTSELDPSNQRQIADLLIEMEVQLFVTSIERKRLLSSWDKAKEISVFHMKQCEVNKIESLPC